MNLERFLSEREGRWTALDDAVRRARGRPERLGADGVRALGANYRAAVADLALARRLFPSDPVTRRLEQLVLAARQLVYLERPRTASAWQFLATGYWRAVRGRPLALGVCAGLLAAGAGLGILWGATDPGAAAGIVPGEFIDGADPPSGDRGLGTAEAAAFSSQLFTNNIQVAALAFAAGIAFGLGTAALLLFNGLILGVVIGLSIDAGTADTVLTLIVAHGVLELSCIVVGAAAGARIGWALVDPGTRRRGEALREEAREAIKLVVGTMPWLVVAGIVEAFVSPSGAATTTVVAVGLGLGALYWTLVAWRGRAPAVTAEPALSP